MRSDEKGSMVAELSQDCAPASARQAWSESSRDELFARLACEHLRYPLAPGLRQLAQQSLYAVLGLLFPHFAPRTVRNRDQLAGELAAVEGLLEQALTASIPAGASRAGASTAIGHLCSRLGSIREALLLDAEAIYAGDPAAEGVDEVILAYPGFMAIAT
jgi:serine O-acetyltransferase